jgi:hypothetical protein
MKYLVSPFFLLSYFEISLTRTDIPPLLSSPLLMTSPSISGIQFTHIAQHQTTLVFPFSYGHTNYVNSYDWVGNAF